MLSSDNNIERAGDWIFSHADELDKDDDEPKKPVAGETFRDGNSSKFLLWPLFSLANKNICVVVTVLSIRVGVNTTFVPIFYSCFLLYGIKCILFKFLLPFN